jgi:hypothetical protein
LHLLRHERKGKIGPYLAFFANRLLFENLISPYYQGELSARDMTANVWRDKENYLQFERATQISNQCSSGSGD